MIYQRLGTLQSNNLAVCFGPSFFLNHIVGIAVFFLVAILGHGKIFISVGHDLLVLITMVIIVKVLGKWSTGSGAAA